MRVYYQSIDYDLQLAIVNGPYLPKTWVNGVETSQPKGEYDENDKNLSLSLSQFQDHEYNVLCFRYNEFNCLYSCPSTHDIWHALEVTHEGTSQVKE